MSDSSTDHPAFRDLALKTPAGFVASGFGSGLSPVAPGTAGTVAAIPLALALVQLPGKLFIIVVVLAFALGVYVSEVTGRRLGQEDPGGIVWDEMVGFWIAVALIPVSWLWWLAAFFVFRAFDIFKPWPVSFADQRLHGGWGIMLDDVIAGFYTMAVLWIAGRLI